MNFIINGSLGLLIKSYLVNSTAFHHIQVCIFFFQFDDFRKMLTFVHVYLHARSSNLIKEIRQSLK